MADNVRYTEPGSGTTFATDDVGGVHYQICKLAFGPLDTATLVSTANGFPVQQQGTWTVSGAVTANAGAGLNTTALALESGGNLAAVAGAVRAEDTPSANADAGIGLLAVRKAAPANLSNADGDYEFIQINGGRVWVSATIDAALPAGTNVLGGVTQSGTWTVGLAAGTNNIGDVDVLTLPPLPAGANSIGTVVLSRDAGRTAINLYATNVASGATGAETAITLTRSAGTGATTSAATFVVTNGKKFRIQAITFASRGNATATAQVTTFSLRLNAAGAVTTASTPILLQARTATPATALAWDRVSVPIPDGFEIAGDGTLQIGVTANAVFVTNAPTWDVWISGYEY